MTCNDLFRHIRSYFLSHSLFNNFNSFIKLKACSNEIAYMSPSTLRNPFLSYFFIWPRKIGHVLWSLFPMSQSAVTRLIHVSFGFHWQWPVISPIHSRKLRLLSPSINLVFATCSSGRIPPLIYFTFFMNIPSAEGVTNNLKKKTFV